MSGTQFDQYQRIEEHKRFVVGKHLKGHGQNSSDLSKNFTILRKCKNKFDCLAHETLLIKQYTDSLTQLGPNFFSMPH